jgi:hypothetical protein
MKSRLARIVLALVGILALLSGCESYDHRAASVSPQFPPAPVTPENSPDIQTSH